MKSVLFFLCLVPLSFSAQRVSAFGGMTRNIFFDHLSKKYGSYISSYNDATGFTAGLGIDSALVDWLTMRFTFQFEQYSGHLDVSEGNKSGGTRTKAAVTKSIVSLGVFPINIRILNRIKVNLGFDISVLANDSFSGSESNWNYTGKATYYILQEHYSKFSAPLFLGLRGRIRYDIFVSEKICLTPHYGFYFGGSGGFWQFPEKTRSIRHMVGIGIKKRTK